MKTLISKHPNPIFARETYLNLNGSWQFEIDNEVCGKELKYYKNHNFSQVINVPFCPESELSGINNKNFMQAVWYKKTITLNQEQLNGRVFYT